MNGPRVPAPVVLLLAAASGLAAEGRPAATGVYLLSLIAHGQRQLGKVLLVR